MAGVPGEAKSELLSVDGLRLHYLDWGPPDDVLASFVGPPVRQAFATFLETADTELIASALEACW